MLEMRIRRLFFDKPKVLRAVDRAKREVLSRAGAFIRQRARTSIRPRKSVSPPGLPPHSHTGVLRRFIGFGYDPGRDTVVVGPARTNQVFFDRHRRPVKGTVPAVLEYGGKITILEVFKYGRWQRADLHSRRRLAGLPKRYRTARVRPRPYMGPALEKERPKRPKLWADSVREG